MDLRLSFLLSAAIVFVGPHIILPPQLRQPPIALLGKAGFMATGRTVDAIREIIDADSLGYLSVEALHEAVNGDPTGAGFCNACFTGEYPIPVQLQLDKLSLERTLPPTE